MYPLCTQMGQPGPVSCILEEDTRLPGQRQGTTITHGTAGIIGFIVVSHLCAPQVHEGEAEGPGKDHAAGLLLS